MFDNIKEACRMFFKSRLVVATVVMILLFSILLWRVFSLQIVNGKEYQDNYTLKIVKERTLNVEIYMTVMAICLPTMNWHIPLQSRTMVLTVLIKQKTLPSMRRSRRL